MTISAKSEQSLLTHDEREVVRVTHHPAILELAAKDLKAQQIRLRQLHDKERTMAWQKRREVRGKADARGGSFPGTAERSLLRKQVFAGAVQRLNKEISRVERLSARSTTAAGARRALALRKAGESVHHPKAGATAHKGMQSNASTATRTKVNPAKVGSISQATKKAQATRDKRP